MWSTSWTFWVRLRSLSSPPALRRWVKHRGDEFADSGAVEVVDMGEIEDDFLFALCDEIANRVAQFADLGAEDDAPLDKSSICDVRDFAGGNG